VAGVSFRKRGHSSLILRRSKKTEGTFGESGEASTGRAPNTGEGSRAWCRHQFKNILEKVETKRVPQGKAIGESTDDQKRYMFCTCREEQRSIGWGF